MTQVNRVLLLFAAALMGMAVGSLWADEATPASKDQASPPAANTTEAKPASKPDSPTVAAMKEANALAEAGKTDEAVAAYEKMGVLKTKRMEAWRLNNEGLAYLTAITPAPDKALPLLEKAVEMDEDNYTAWNNLGIAYEQSNQLQKAKDAYQKSIDKAKEQNVSSAKAEGNLANLEPRLAKWAALNGESKTDENQSADKNSDTPEENNKKN